MVTNMVFLNKEIKEYYRSGRLFIFGIAALLFGIMNPAIAKLTPWLLETMAETMKESGMTVSITEANALSCWQQYYKNIPMLFLVFFIFSAGCFPKEYSKGSLLLVITKGYPRRKIYLAKAAMIFASYTAVNLVYFGMTWFYSNYYWDNSVLNHIFYAALLYYIFGLLVLALLLFFSSFLTESTQVIGAIAAVLAVVYLVGIIPKTGKYLPTKLTGGEGLLTGKLLTGDFTPAIIITLAAAAVLFFLGLHLFGKKTDF